MRLLDSAVALPSSELNLVRCDPQACLDLPADLVPVYARECANADPPTTRLILPPRLTELPAWIFGFDGLRQLLVHGFAGDADAALERLGEKLPDLACDISSHRTADAEAPLGQDVRAHAETTTLRSIYRPFIGKLDEDAKTALEHFMDKVREAAGPPRSNVAESNDFHVGGFKVVRSLEGGLTLSKLETPPYVEPSIPSSHRESLPKTIEVFHTHFEQVQLPVWQAMSKCGYVDYLQSHGATLIDGEWDILVNIDPYFGRRPTQNIAHKDTSGENMFLLILHCSDEPVMGMEYQLRPKNPDDYLPIMRRQLPSVFVDEVQDVLREPPDGIAYAPTVEPWGFIAGCDELMAHSTPFIHHRGAFDMDSVVKCMGRAVRSCFGPAAFGEYLFLQAQQSSLGSAHARGAHAVTRQLKELLSFDQWIDHSALETRLSDAGLADEDARKLVQTLSKMADTVDPFDGTATLDVPPLAYAGEMEVARGNALRREMSVKLDQGQVHPYPAKRDYLRVWIMARRKDA